MEKIMNKKDFSGTKISLLDNKTREMGNKKSTDMHIHDDVQLLAGNSGILEVSIASKKINLRVGDIMLINSRTPHSVRPILPFTTTAVIQIPVEELFYQKIISGATEQITNYLCLLGVIILTCP